RRRHPEGSPMPLSAAVASPELASGKVWIDADLTNKDKGKENAFLSVGELLERQEQPQETTVMPATELIVEQSESNTRPLGFITQPANDAVEKKVQESLQRLHEVAEPVKTEQNTAKIDRTFNFEGRLGTFSAVQHIQVGMTLAKASEEVSIPFKIVAWQESRYYFHGKGSAGHNSAVSHIYAEPTQAKAE
ncbi:MAG TPA: ribonuclease E, partial [Pasteurellaceae bacterium]|nr:ribonuclease E [Pasteurellaceae bacterium]